MIRINDLIQEDYDNVQKQKIEFRSRLRDALAKDGGLDNGEPGVHAQALLDLWMEDPRNMLDADDLEFILDDETLFNNESSTF